jgi:[ribosomal protein S5]-alanine N-acetyltransferase
MDYLLDKQESERLLFRKLLPSDFDKWVEFMKNPESTEYMWLTDSSDPADKCKVWFDRVFSRYEINKGGMNVLINKINGDFVGQSGLLFHTIEGIEELEIGYAIMPQFRGQGFATEAAKKCRDFAFGNNLKDTLISIIHPGNIYSKKVAANVGMTLEKKVTKDGRNFNIYRILKGNC